MSAPDVSVVMAVKNEQIYLESSVSSIVTQAGLSLELIIVDDGSADQTFEIAGRLASVHSNIKLLRNPSTGKAAAFNFGIANASGRFCCLFAGDDLMPEGSLATRFTAVRDAPEDQKVVGLCRLITLSENRKFHGHLVPRKPGRGALSGVSYLLNRNALARLFPVPEELPNEDTWLEIAVSFLPDLTIIHSDVVGCEWRVHDGNSMNFLFPFEKFSRRYASRMRAFRIFHDRYRNEIGAEANRTLSGLIECEQHRASGNPVGVLLSRASFIPRMRALSLSGPLMYAIRKRMYGLLSGW
jgi:glycosyltransferase involved in cell wall biosynthesis